MTASAYPLSWPERVPRCRVRETGKFKTTLPAALKNVEDSLRRFGSDSGKTVTGIVLSSNVTLGATRPQDPGVAVWFGWDGLQVCIPIDRYTSVEANLQAIHHIIEARRVELRHGTLALVRATFEGFRALPPPPNHQSWRAVLGLVSEPGVTKTMVEGAYRHLAASRHPDKPGGSHEKMTALNHARDEAMKELGS